MSKYRNVAFLAELLVNVLVFSISCAVLAGLFGQAARISRETREESFATTEIYSLFETVRARGPEALSYAEPAGADGLVCYYDRQWLPADEDLAAYTVLLHIEEQASATGVLRQINAAASDIDGRQICEFTTQTYHPDEGGASA